MSKVGTHLCDSHKKSGYMKEHVKCSNHNNKKVANLLAVPCYADLLETVEAGGELGEQDTEEWQPVLVRLHKDWRKAMEKWLPQSLELLFSKRKDVDIDEQEQRHRCQQVYTEEAQLMELLVDEAAGGDPMPDDGELEGSGDDFEG
ncbi:hypothetical protein BDQ17DRAFT_1330640 [Cyathus striatus]|nr:hypothetical protein BDQ17DRAFT_1330640 [Cyathus striatus]